MKVLFLTMVKIEALSNRGIYTDLLRKFESEGHEVFVVSPTERREKQKTTVKKSGNATFLNIRTFNLQKTNLIEKGVGTLAMEYQYLNGIRTYFADVKFDVVLYSTPPITFSKVISYIKKKDNAFAYLLLKDIFPQNAIDMKMMKEMGFLHKFFLKKEQKLYHVSDCIGVMSEANRNYVLQHNPEIKPQKVEINPNSIEPVFFDETLIDKASIRNRYGIPQKAKVFVYGGNLGKPQGLEFLLETIEASTSENHFFLIVGSGTEFGKLQQWFDLKKPSNSKLISGLPKLEFDNLLMACDFGLIFLHKNFTIPNFPSRLLSYLEMGLPVVCATDVSTDVGSAVEKAGCGYWVASGDIKGMLQTLEQFDDAQEVAGMKQNARKWLNDEFTVQRSYDLIAEKIQKQ